MSTSKRPVVRLGDLLIQAGAITKAQLGEALALQTRSGGRLGSNLIEMGAVDERTLAHVLAQQLQIPSASAAQLERATKQAIDRVTRALAERHRVIPLRIDGARLWVAMADPLDRDAIAAIEQECGLEVRPMVAPDVLIDFALGKHYGVRRKPRVIHTRDADLLDVEPVEELATYDPHAPAARPSPQRAAQGPASTAAPQPANLGFLDERPSSATPSRPPPPPAAPRQVAPRQVAPRQVAPLPAPTEHLRARLLAATSDDQVFDALLDELVPDAARLAILLLRGGVLVAHRGRGIDPRSLSMVRIQLQEAPTLSRVLEGGAPYLGPLPSQLGGLFQEVGAPSGLVLPVTMGRRAIGLIIGGQVSETLARRVPALTRAVSMVDLALHIGHLRGKLARA